MTGLRSRSTGWAHPAFRSGSGIRVTPGMQVPSQAPVQAPATAERPFYALSPVFEVGPEEFEFEVGANWSLVPTGLTAGDKFRLLFIAEHLDVHQPRP